MSIQKYDSIMYRIGIASIGEIWRAYKHQTCQCLEFTALVLFRDSLELMKISACVRVDVQHRKWNTNRVALSVLYCHTYTCTDRL